MTQKTHGMFRPIVMCFRAHNKIIYKYFLCYKIYVGLWPAAVFAKTNKS